MKIIVAIILFISMIPLLSEEITILKSGEWKPYYYYNQNQKLEGFLIDLFNKVEEISDIKFRYEDSHGWSRALQYMRESKYDSFMPIFKTPEREEFMIYSENNIIAYEEDIIISLKDSKIEFDGDLSTLYEYRIGVVKEYSYGKSFDNDTNLDKVVVGDENLLVKLLLSGKRYDCIVGDKLVMRSILESMNCLDKVKFSKGRVVYAPLYLVFAKDRVPLEKINQFSAALIEAKKQLNIK